MQSRPGDREFRGPAAEDVKKLSVSPPAVAAAGTARATATAFEKALAPAPAPRALRTARRGTRLAAEETSARLAARAYFEQENLAGNREVESPVWNRMSRNGSLANGPVDAIDATVKFDTDRGPGRGSRAAGTRLVVAWALRPRAAAAFRPGARP